MFFRHCSSSDTVFVEESKSVWKKNSYLYIHIYIYIYIYIHRKYSSMLGAFSQNQTYKRIVIEYSCAYLVQNRKEDFILPLEGYPVRHKSLQLIQT